MEEIYCPLCGKPNPVENKFCDFCLAHLKPPEGESPESDKVQFPGIDDNQDGLGNHASDSEVPSWLSEIKGEDQGETEQLPETEPGTGKPDEAISDWMTGISEAEKPDSLSSDELLPSGAVPPVDPFLPGQKVPATDNLPEWLNEALGEEEPPEVVEPDIWADPFHVGDDPDIQQEDSTPTKPIDETPESLENAGPLVGLKGVLSAEPGVARARIPAAYSTKLKVTANQRAHVDLMKTLIEDEDQPLPLPRRGSISQQHVLRWAIALILLMVVLWPIVTSSKQMPYPNYDEGSAEVNRLINQLPKNERVLVGFDYEPGLAAELDAAGDPVIDHLMSQEALLTLVSTSPTGPILAERFMREIQADYEYKNGEDYVNLGYIPGGAAGLQSFFKNPQGTLPDSIDRLSAWGTDSQGALPALAGINQITDYAMVILLVDDPDIARIWIEQLGPSIIEPDVLTSFVLIASAQLEPVIRPYFESSPQPVNGMVVGLRGGAAYSRLMESDGIPREYWDAFGMGAFVAALLILVGGLGYYVIPELSSIVQDQGRT
jgi:hypothetical protein